MTPPPREPAAPPEKAWPPLRAVTGIETRLRWSPGGGNYETVIERLVCGHAYQPKDNAHMGGTDVGERKRRRCKECR